MYELASEQWFFAAGLRALVLRGLRAMVLRGLGSLRLWGSVSGPVSELVSEHRFFGTSVRVGVQPWASALVCGKEHQGELP